MKKAIRWASDSSSQNSFIHRSSSPFEKSNHQRPIKITLYDSTLKDLDEREKNALNILREFASRENPNYIILGTEKDSINFMEIGDQGNNDFIPIAANYSNGNTLHSKIILSNQIKGIAAHLLRNTAQNSLTIDQVIQDTTFAFAHCELQQDILVTTSDLLLKNKDQNFFERANPCLPSDAVKILGLLLRSRDDYQIYVDATCNRGLFYLVLTRYLLPNYEIFSSLCLKSEMHRHDQMTSLSQSILIRGIRVLQAKDYLGYCFYVKQDNDIRDELMYHFSYLTLLLSGILDVQAKIASRVYFPKPPIHERNISFRNYSFVTDIAKFDLDFYHYLQCDYFKDITTLISKTRNTIHGAEMQVLAYEKK